MPADTCLRPFFHRPSVPSLLNRWRDRAPGGHAVAGIGRRRRAVLTTGLIVLTAGLVAPASVAARPLLRDGFGIVGGGTALTPDGEAHFSLFASELLIVDDDGSEISSVVGHVRWVDPAWRGRELTLESVEVTAYVHIGDSEPHRHEVRGLMSANGAGRYPFLLRAADAGPPGSGQDMVTLLVGFPAGEVGTPPVASGFVYAADATLVAGDIAEVKFGTPTAG